MSWFAVYRIDTGGLVSVGSSVVTDSELATRGLAKKVFADRPDQGDVEWDERTKDFVPLPPRVFNDRVDDFIADSDVARVWSSLTVAQQDALRDGLITLLGNERLRNPTESKVIR